MNRSDFFRLDELPPEHPLRQTPLRAPDGYFDALPSRIQARAVQPKRQAAFPISWSWQRTVGSLAAAGLVAVLVWQTVPQKQTSIGPEALEGVSKDVIASYLDDQGIEAYQMADNSQIHQSLGKDTTAVDFLNVQPADIRQQINTLTETEFAELGT